MEIILFVICLFLIYKIYTLEKVINILAISINSICSYDHDFWSED